MKSVLELNKIPLNMLSIIGGIMLKNCNNDDKKVKQFAKYSARRMITIPLRKWKQEGKIKSIQEYII